MDSSGREEKKGDAIKALRENITKTVNVVLIKLL